MGDFLESLIEIWISNSWIHNSGLIIVIAIILCSVCRYIVNPFIMYYLKNRPKPSKPFAIYIPPPAKPKSDLEYLNDAFENS